MKKKRAAKKSAGKKSSGKLGKRGEGPPPGKIGGRTPSPKTTWAKLGRRKLDTGETYSAIGTELKEIREQQEISVSKLARELEVAPATLIKFEERGYPISIKVVAAMAQKLGYELKLKPVPKSGVRRKKKKK